MSPPQPMQAAEFIDSEFRPGMSNRQRNKAKRMAKLVAKQRSRDLDPNEKRYYNLRYTDTFLLLLDLSLHLEGLDQAAMLCVLIVSNDSFEGEPEEKRRKTTNVVIEQPAAENKVLIDNIPDNSSLFEEVCKRKYC